MLQLYRISFSIVKLSCIDHFFYFSRLEFLVSNHVKKWQIFFEEFIWKWVLFRVPRGRNAFVLLVTTNMVVIGEVLGTSRFFMG